MRVGLEPISTSDYAALIGQIWPAVEAVEREGEYGGVTFFEMLTGLAMAHFRNVGADFQVLEVGMGGRLDSTNIVTPEVSVITSISLDHVNVLGDTIEKIASAKAGIIKDGAPCVVGPQAESDAMRVFERTTREHGAELISVSDRFSWEIGDSDVHGQRVRLSGGGRSYDLWTPLLGDYQAENVATAVAAAEALIQKGYDIPTGAIEAGAREVSWPGRFEVFSVGGKTVVADGAHNPYSIRRLVENLRDYVGVRRGGAGVRRVGRTQREGYAQGARGSGPESRRGSFEASALITFERSGGHRSRTGAEPGFAVRFGGGGISVRGRTGRAGRSGAVRGVSGGGGRDAGRDTRNRT